METIIAIRCRASSHNIVTSSRSTNRPDRAYQFRMMKHLSVFAAIVALATTTSLAIDDIHILPSRIKLDSSKNNTGNTNVESTDIAYSVEVNSSSFKELTGVTVKYNIFYEIVRVGAKGESDVKLSAGSHTFPSLLTNKAVKFETEPIKLAKASLDAGWFYTNGASAKASDRVVGVWFKAFDSTGKQIGEYVNPASVTTKRKWKD